MLQFITGLFVGSAGVSFILLLFQGADKRNIMIKEELMFGISIKARLKNVSIEEYVNEILENSFK